MVYGDYDVDGTTAVALVYKYLQNFYSEIDFYIPTRYDEGYGISKPTIDAAAADGVKLIIILDCGIKAIDDITPSSSSGPPVRFLNIPQSMSMFPQSVSRAPLKSIDSGVSDRSPSRFISPNGARAESFL